MTIDKKTVFAKSKHIFLLKICAIDENLYLCVMAISPTQTITIYIMESIKTITTHDALNALAIKKITMASAQCKDAAHHDWEFQILDKMQLEYHEKMKTATENHELNFLPIIIDILESTMHAFVTQTAGCGVSVKTYDVLTANVRDLHMLEGMFS